MANPGNREPTSDREKEQLVELREAFKSRFGKDVPMKEIPTGYKIECRSGRITVTDPEGRTIYRRNFMLYSLALWSAHRYIAFHEKMKAQGVTVSRVD